MRAMKEQNMLLTDFSPVQTAYLREGNKKTAYNNRNTQMVCVSCDDCSFFSFISY